MYLAYLAGRIPWRLPGPPAVVTRALAFLGGLSFPLFLVRYPLIFLVNHWRGKGWSTPKAILAFLALSLVLSWAVDCLDARIPRRRILRWFGFGPGSGAACGCPACDGSRRRTPVWLLTLPPGDVLAAAVRVDVEVVDPSPTAPVVRGEGVEDGAAVLGIYSQF